jgi:hypothetical protein
MAGSGAVAKVTTELISGYVLFFLLIRGCISNNFPNQAGVNVKVFMSKYISQCNNL